MTSLVVRIDSYPRTKDIDTVNVTVSVGVGGKEPGALWIGTLVRTERDYLDTLVEAVTMSYMYGEDRRGVARAAAGVKTLARRHGLASDF